MGDHGAGPTPKRTKRVVAMLAAAIVVVTFLTYLPALRGGFVWDDQDYVISNPHLTPLDAETLRWAVTGHHAGNWHPLTWLSHAVDVALFGYEPFGHHLVNVGLHALDAALLLWALFGLTGKLRRSAVVAALFALHPIHVESVAWVAERKDLLSACFALLALIAYERYARGGGARWYAAVLVAFAAGLASKPMVVTLPFVLLLLDAWPLRRFGPASILEKIPMLALSACSSVATLVIQSAERGVTSFEVIGLATRLQNAIVSYVRYLWHTVWPVGLSPYYAYPEIEEPPLAGWVLPLAAIVLLGISLVALAERRRRPYLLVGWLCYLGTLVPVIGLVQAGRQAMADRYMYLPSIGLFLAAVWLIAERIPPSRRGSRAATAVTLCLLAVLAAMSWSQIGIWRDTETLWKRALETAPASWVPRYSLGNALMRRGALEEAVRQFEVAARVRDAGDRAQALSHIGVIRRQQGRLGEASAALEQAVRLAPADATIRGNHANALVQTGRLDAAERAYRAALALEATPAERAFILRNFGILLIRQERLQEAIEILGQALGLDPGPAAHEALAYAYATGGDLDRAMAVLRAGIDAHPEEPSLRLRLRLLEGGTP